MATTQYIGARYVPILADPVEWSSAKTYEALTIVTHEGNSYTSRQFVPIGIDIANGEYWALTGNYNAQIEQYRRETADAVDSANTATETANDVRADMVPTIRAEIAKLVTVPYEASFDDIQMLINTYIGTHIMFQKTQKYDFDETLNVPAGSNIDFNGCTIKRVSNVHDVIDISGAAERTVIANLIIDGNNIADNLTPTNPDHRFSGIKINNVAYATFKNITITGVCNAEIQDEGNNAAFMLQNCSFISIYDSYFYNNDRTAILFDLCNNVNIINCSGKDNLGSFTTGTCNNLAVISCNAINSGYSAISSNGTDILYMNCTSINSGYSGFNIGHAHVENNSGVIINCYSDHAELDGITGTNCDLTVINFKQENTTRQAIRKQATTSDIKKLYVLNSDFENAGFLLQESSAIFENCTFYIDKENLTLFNDTVNTSIFIKNSKITSRSFLGNILGNITFEHCNVIGTQQHTMFGGTGKISFIATEFTGYTSFGSSNVYRQNFYGAIQYQGTGISIYKLPFFNVAVVFIQGTVVTSATVPDDFRSLSNTRIPLENNEFITINGTTIVCTATQNVTYSFVYRTA